MVEQNFISLIFKKISILLIFCLAITSYSCSDDASGNSDDDHTIVSTESCTPPCWQESQQIIRPPKRYFHAMVYDEKRQVTVLFGGKDENFEFISDTWEFDGAWHLINTQDHPSNRWKSSICYSPQEECIILFGGESSTWLNDTWKYDGNNWTKIVTNHYPERRANAAMIYDDHIDKILLFGGEGFFPNPYPDTTWFFDGVDWTELDTTSSGLYGREGLKMAYDVRRERTVLYGGTAAISYYNTTWEFNGQTWEQIHPPHNPGTIAYYAMAYDKSIAKTVLFGGGPFTGYTDKTWEYDGNDWIEINVDLRPPATIAHSMVYDSKRKHFIMFGGARNYGTICDGTWFYFGEKPTLETPSIKPAIIAGILCIFPFFVIIKRLKKSK